MLDGPEKFQWLVRLGFAARGLVYLLIGYLALSAASQQSGPEGAFGLLRDVPLGIPLLYLAALGLLGYAIYRLCSLLFDIENHGREAKGLAHRIGHGASAVAHLVLAWTAIQFARGQTDSGGGSQEAAGSLLSFGFGSVVLGVAGLGFLLAGAMQAKSAITADFMATIARGAPRFAEPLGRGGYAARAVVFVIIGWSLVQSAWLNSSGEIKTLGEAVVSLRDDGLLYSLVAVGLVLFGAFSLFLARYRIIPELDAARLRRTI